jgi:hypothetical protein
MLLEAAKVIKNHEGYPSIIKLDHLRFSLHYTVQ